MGPEILAWAFFLLLTFFSLSSAAAYVPLSESGSDQGELRWDLPVEMDSGTSLDALIFMGRLLVFQMHRIDLLCKIYVAKSPGAAAPPDVCGL